MASFEGRSDRVPPRLAGVARWAPTDDHRERAARRLARGDAATPWRSPDRRPDEAASVRGRPLTATEAGVLGPGFDFSNLPPAPPPAPVPSGGFDFASFASPAAIFGSHSPASAALPQSRRQGTPTSTVSISGSGSAT